MSNRNAGPPADRGSNHDDPRTDVNGRIQDTIGRALQAHYQALVLEPIPDRLIDLLAELEAGALSDE
ncbi:MAG: NepR family anti-sigma factor [Beijerinckiaceae bacterium]|nr:NepR family anti-sigma factor [Beijerinckiaceae bacterium]MCZ8300375.1 NepR family anti-sigma factor [Beijerinckiaceae bacterium]